MELSVYDEEKLMYIPNRLTMSTVIICCYRCYCYFILFYLFAFLVSKCQPRELQWIVSMLNCDLMMEPVIGICIYLILI